MATTIQKPRILVVGADVDYARALGEAAAKGGGAEVMALPQPIEAAEAKLDITDVAVLILEVEVGKRDSLMALQRVAARLKGAVPIVAATDAFDERVARWLLQLRVADFVVKSTGPADALRVAIAALQSPGDMPKSETRIAAFIGAAGGVGVTTLAIQTAFLLGQTQRGGRRPSVALVDLDVQHGSCADYLDLEPRLDLGEIEGRPERLDRQLLEVMISRHASGLALIAAPTRPAEMRSFDPAVVTHLLDLVSAHYDHVVVDMPRTWFQWTDDVLAGSDDVYVVTEMTVPSLRHAQRLVASVSERLSEGTTPKVIVNRFEERVFGPGLKRQDVEAALGEAFAGTVPNSYRLVREAIDRGVPLEDVKAGNEVTVELKKIVIPPPKVAPSVAARTAASFPFLGLFSRA